MDDRIVNADMSEIPLIFPFIQILIGFIILGYAAIWLVSGASSMAQHFGLSKLVVGITIVAIGTSAPEIAVSAMAALGGDPNISVGNIVGSNIANTALVLPLACIAHPLTLPNVTLKRDLPIVFVCTLLVYVLMINSILSRFDAFILLATFIGLITALGWSLRSEKKTIQAYEVPRAFVGEAIPTKIKEMAFIALGLLLIPVSAHIVIEGAKEIAHYLHISDLFVGLFITAVGTSLPELAITVASLMKREKSILIGNIMGSNVCNLLFALPLAAIARPAHFSPVILFRDIPFLTGITILLMVMGYIGKKSNRLGFAKSLLLLVLYGCYILYIGFSERI